MELDGQGIERRDFPISRRGYEPAAVDAHLHAVSAAVAEVRREAQRGESLGASAANQVQSILDAAEATASDIVSQAQQTARRAIESAEMEARRTRQEAIAKAEAHVAAVAEATATLRGGVEAMDGELGGLVERLRAGAAKLGGDLAALEQGMASLYDAAARGPVPAPAAAGEQPILAPAMAVAAPAPAVAAPAAPVPVAAPDLDLPAAAPLPPAVPQPAPAPVAAPPPTPVAASVAGPSGDLDGARLVALNMALNGDSREATDRYLAENFDLSEREKLIDEVYAAIEG